MSFEWPAKPVQISDDIQELARLKKAFANELLFDPEDAFKAARAVLGENDPGKCLYVSQYWPKDEFVKECMSNLLKEHGALHYLPNKAEVGRELIKLARDGKTESGRLSGYRLYAELMGMMPEKSGASNNTQVNVVGSQKVLVVKDHGDDDAWQQKTFEHQQQLLSQAAEDLRDD